MNPFAIDDGKIGGSLVPVENGRDPPIAIGRPSIHEFANGRQQLGIPRCEIRPTRLGLAFASLGETGSDTPKTLATVFIGNVLRQQVRPRYRSLCVSFGNSFAANHVLLRLAPEDALKLAHPIFLTSDLPITGPSKTTATASSSLRSLRQRYRRFGATPCRRAAEDRPPAA